MIGIVAAALFAGYMLVFAAVHKGGLHATNPWSALEAEYGSQAEAASVGALAQQAGASEPSSGGLNPWVSRWYHFVNPFDPGAVLPGLVAKLWPF